MTTAIIVAAGKSTRMGTGSDKAFMALAGKPVIAWSLLALERCKEIDQIVLVVRKDELVAAQTVSKMFGISKLGRIVSGGARRQESVKAGLDACDPETSIVVIHDGARPLAGSALFSAVVQEALKGGAVTVGRPVVDTLKQADKLEIVKTVSREKLYQVQTPQAFPMSILRKAYARQSRKEFTDDCMAVEQLGEKVRIFETKEPNLKITTVEDLQVAAALLK